MCIDPNEKTKETEWNKRLYISFPFDIHNRIGKEYYLYTSNIVGLKLPSLSRSCLCIQGIKH